MKLLDKNAIVALKGKERKMEIDEGVKLAKKIDLLRETSSQEEARLAQFRTESLKKVKEDIEFLTFNRDDLKNQIKVLSEERRILQVPLDAEWEKVNRHSSDLLQRETDLEAEMKSIKNIKQEIEKQVEEIKMEKERVEDLKERTNNKLTEVDLHSKEVEKIMEDTKRSSNETLKALLAFQDELGQKENEIAYRETDVRNQLAQIELDRKTITEERIRVQDREMVLEREIARRKKIKALQDIIK